MAAQQSPKLLDEGSNPSRPAITALDILALVTIIGILGFLAFLLGQWVAEWLIAGFRIDWFMYRFFWTQLGYEPFYATQPPFG